MTAAPGRRLLAAAALVLALVLVLAVLAGCTSGSGGGESSAHGSTTVATPTIGGPDAGPDDGPRVVTVPSPPPQRDWTPAGEASIRPGVQIRTEGIQCTSSFVFVEEGAAAEGALYISQAAHCSGLGGPTDVNGCEVESLPLGTEVAIDGAEHPGTLVYSSWRAMHRVGEADRATCRFNDFALVRIHPDDHDRVNPTIPTFGGPTGLTTAGVPTGDPVYSFGNSVIRLGIDALNLQQGVSVAEGGGGWTHSVLTLTPGIPGDSGSGFLGPEGRALGLLSTGNLITSDISDLGRALGYMERHSDLRVTLATGTEPFSNRGGAPALPEPEPAPG